MKTIMQMVLDQVQREAWKALTRPQQDFLVGAFTCTPPHPRAVRFDWSGMSAKGSQLRVASRLEKLGLIEYVDHGRTEDDNNGDREVPIYRITQKGTKLLRDVKQPDAVAEERRTRAASGNQEE